MLPLRVSNLCPVIICKPWGYLVKVVTGVNTLPQVGSSIIVPVHCCSWFVARLWQACVITAREDETPCYRTFITYENHTGIGESLNAIIRIVVCSIIGDIGQKCLRSKLDIEACLVIECSGNEG